MGFGFASLIAGPLIQKLIAHVGIGTRFLCWVSYICCHVRILTVPRPSSCWLGAGRLESNRCFRDKEAEY